MRCKVFSVPVESEQAIEGERKLNDFLEATDVKQVFASLADHPEGPVWSVLFLYEDGAQTKQRTSPSFFCEDGAKVAQKTPPRHTVAAVSECQTPPAAMDSGTPLTREQVKSIVALKKWRADQAALEGVPLYMVAQNRWLEDMVRKPGRTLDDLMKIQGLGEWRVQKYGARILEILNPPTAAKRSWPGSSYSAGRA